MLGSINKVMLVGNLGRDPEIRHTTEGKRIATLSIATSEAWKDKVTGERKEKTEWHRTVILNDKLSELAEKYLRKGSKVFIEGQLQTRKWTDNDQKEHYSTEVVLAPYRGELTLLDSKNNNLENAANSSVLTHNPYSNTFSPKSAGMDVNNSSNNNADNYSNYQGISNHPKSPIIDDEVPF